MISHRLNQNKDRNGHLDFLLLACIYQLEVSVETVKSHTANFADNKIDHTSFLHVASCSLPAYCFLAGYHTSIVPLCTISNLDQYNDPELKKKNPNNDPTCSADKP